VKPQFSLAKYIGNPLEIPRSPQGSTKDFQRGALRALLFEASTLGPEREYGTEKTTRKGIQPMKIVGLANENWGFNQ